ncbi:MAG: hypothetical protein ACXWV0_06120 [Flavisolibacter sp.]
MKGKISGAIPVILVFIILNALFIAGRSPLEKWGADQTVLILGNTFIFLITLVSFFIARRGLKNPNPNVFMRSVMGSIMIKMLLVVILAFIYISMYKKGINKPALFTCMGLYLVYTFIEVRSLMNLLKQKSNG